jgi:hypothetical protein
MRGRGSERGTADVLTERSGIWRVCATDTTPWNGTRRLGLVVQAGPGTEHAMAAAGDSCCSCAAWILRTSRGLHRP